jgi:hypothetical protein
MIRFLLIALLSMGCLLGAAQTTAQSPVKAARYALTVEEALTFAKNNNIQVKNALLAVQTQKETNKEITAGALPSISFNANLMD